MRFLFLRTVFLLFIFLSTTANSLELSPSPLRHKVLERLNQLNCAKTFSSSFSTPATPVVRTRGITRGGPSLSVEPRATFPAKIEEFNQRFGQVIGIEFDLPWGRDDDPTSFEFLMNDLYESSEKLSIFKELGFVLNANRSAFAKNPNWLEFAKNYKMAAERRGLRAFRPAMALVRGSGKVKEYLLIDPLTESLPNEMNEWQVINKDMEFNLPFNVILKGMRQGKFPLLDAAHDISHFITFLRFPELTNALHQQSVIAAEKPSRGFQRRQYWLIEALSVLAPESHTSNKQFLKKQGRPTAPYTVEEIENDLLRMKNGLVDYAYKSAIQFESSLKDISGGNSNSAEKWYYLSESFGMRAKDLLEIDESFERDNLTLGSKAIETIAALAKTYFNNGKVALSANPKPITNETATFSFSTFVAAQKILSMALATGIDLSPMTRKEALTYLAKFTARTELMLATKPFSYEEWGQTMLQDVLDSASPVAQLMMAVFPNDLMIRYYLGVGEKREE